MRRRRPGAFPAGPSHGIGSDSWRGRGCFRRTAGRRGVGRAAGQRRGAADQLDVHANDGQRRPEQAATETAILSANYIAARLADHYDIRFSGEVPGIQGGGVAHECILDLRPLKETSGVTAEDVAKRLIDYGFHAPTLSFPVAGTLMVEPTESEPLCELDRFCDAMIAIRDEIRKVENGVWPQDVNPLKAAPHTAEALLGANWPHPYSREEAAFPVATLRRNKYWVPVGRVDNVHGDRNLVCSCPPLSEYADG